MDCQDIFFEIFIGSKNKYPINPNPASSIDLATNE
jgi:hypothetical protein